jgi:hypothetical protein
MATVTHKHIGETECGGCGKLAPVKETKGGKMKVDCGWCDYVVYAHPGTIFHKTLMAKVRLAPGATAAAGDAGSGKKKEPELATAAAGAKAPWER